VAAQTLSLEHKRQSDNYPISLKRTIICSDVSLFFFPVFLPWCHFFLYSTAM